MSTTSPGTSSQPSSQPARVAPKPTKSRRRPAVIGLGVALVILGGLATFTLVQATGNTVTVLITSADIGRGETITAEDLTTLEIAGGQSVDAIAAADSADALGQIALVDLPAGSLLTGATIGSAIAVEAGKSIVGVALTSSQLPSFPLSAGDTVRVVETPVSQGDPPATTPATFQAIVFTTRVDEATGMTIVDLVVPESRAADVAARAATGRIALIIDGGSR